MHFGPNSLWPTREFSAPDRNDRLPSWLCEQGVTITLMDLILVGASRFRPGHGTERKYTYTAVSMLKRTGGARDVLLIRCFI